MTKKAPIRMFVGGWLEKIKSDIDEEMETLTDEIVRTLAYIGERAVKRAREMGSYQDRTGNLRSSIGYVVLRDGEPVIQGAPEIHQGPDGGGEEGVQAAETLLSQLRSEYPEGLVLIVCAGMNYASYVEDIHGLDVLTSARLDTEEVAERMIRNLLNNIDNNAYGE